MTTYTWKDDGTSGNWSTPARWDPLGPPAAGSDVSISASGGSTVTYNTTVSINVLQVNSGNFSMTGGALTVTGAATFNNNLAISGAATLSLGASTTNTVIGQFTDSGADGSLSLGANAQLSLFGGGSAAASKFTLGSGATLTFFADYTLGAGTTGGTGTVALSQGTLNLGANAVTISGDFSQTGGTVSGTRRSRSRESIRCPRRCTPAPERRLSRAPRPSTMVSCIWTTVGCSRMTPAW